MKIVLQIKVEIILNIFDKISNIDDFSLSIIRKTKF